MKGDVATQAHDDLMASVATKPDYEYAMPGFRGFAGSISEEELVRLQASEHVSYTLGLTKLSSCNQVEYIEQSARIHSNEIVQQNNATWGLARISHAEPYQTSYLFDSSAGEGTCAYVTTCFRACLNFAHKATADTSLTQASRLNIQNSGDVRTKHSPLEICANDWKGALFLADFSGEDTMIDGMGHGTHVAGTIGSMTWGVAKKTTLLAVRVLDSYGSGTTEGVLAGMEYVITDAAKSREAGDCPNGFVANMSLGGRRTQALNDAAAAIVAAGIFLAVAAGNEGRNAELSSPASEPSVCTVGATAINDTLIEWSNYGPIVDILAPGVDITSTYLGGTIETHSGTPQKAPPATNIDQMPQDQRKQLGRMNSLMSPAVTQILEGLGDEGSDSDSSEEKDPSEQEDQRAAQQYTKPALDPQKLRQDKQKHVAAQAPRPSSLSPSRSSLKTTSKSSGHSKPSSAHGSGDKSAKSRQKQPHMARFHSLRSMLFQQRIQDQMKTATQEDCQKEENAADKWRSQHAERQMHNPGTPDQDASGKGGIGSRIRMTVRRMTTKDAGSMEKIREDGAPVEFNDRASTASSDNEKDQREASTTRYESDNESIDHSDVDELVRWVSRRDPPSDGERRKGGDVVEAKEDSGHESLGPSDVEDLVRFASRKSDTKETTVFNDAHSGYSDASTESDSEIREISSDEEEDADDLVRWISHRDGPKAGPVRRNLQRPELDSDVGEHYDSDVPELGRWFKRHDGTSGESAASTPVKETFDEIDEEEQRGRPRSRESIEPIKEKRHITDDDVDELVRWVSRKDSKQDSPVPVAENPIDRLKREEEEKQTQIGMSVDDGSLSHADLQEVVEHARKTSADMVSPPPASPFAVETGDLRVLRDEKTKATPLERDSQRDLDGQRENLDEKKQELGMSLDDESLSHNDVAELIEHVRKI
ncbi:hypothetical protein J4E93_005554 [Alternaria ventricosa]|uniref:uncharacterized protein n=1 Tax=Alternaria ventricosa TaxID=1187951 RepID=UPI0020C41E96|nr:uncharacterized protein J4E93_005554 [Alternaria ventricosa]KAI4645975.1 hypothetical protein J4E93_005554 [Alternaria ventricosa]